MNFLDKKEKENLRARHRHERDGKIRDRIKAVLLFDKGWTYEEIAEALLLSDKSIQNHISEYKDTQKLELESKGSLEKLDVKQAKELTCHLEKHTYLHAKDILPYIKDRWQITYTVAGITSWLKRHGFSYKKPALVPGKANKKSQEEWIEKYNILKKNLSENEALCFIDGVHPTHNVQLAYGWIRKGKRKEIPSNTGRSRINLSGMLDVISHKILAKENKTLNAESTIEFFRNIEENYPTKETIHLFCDNARYYKNKKVKEYLKGSKLKLHFLPIYSPNLNPIERLWKWMKERVMYNTYYKCFDSFRDAILGFLKSISDLAPENDLKKEFRSRIRDRFRSIGSV
jgi:transposase